MKNFIPRHKTPPNPVSNKSTYEKNIKKAPEKIDKAKQIRNRRKKKRIFKVDTVFFVVTVLVCVALIVPTFTVLFKINDIYVDGCEKYESSDIISLSGAQIGSNLLLCDKKAMENRIFNSLPCIESVKVQKRLPSTIEIKVKESEISYAVESGDGFLIVSTMDRIMEKTEEKPQDILIVKGAEVFSETEGDFVRYKDDIAENILQEIQNTAKSIGFNGIKSITVLPVDDIIINYDDRVDISIGDINNIEYKLLTSKEILENKVSKKEKGTLNVRKIQEDNKSYFTPNYVEN